MTAVESGKSFLDWNLAEPIASRRFVCASVVVEERISSAVAACVLVDSVRAAREQERCSARGRVPGGFEFD